MSREAALLGVIQNMRPDLTTEVEHCLYLPELCPATRNPKAGSTLTLRYSAGDKLLELFSLERYIDAFVGHKRVRDMEFFVQTAAQDAANALQTEVSACAALEYRQLRQGQRIVVRARPQRYTTFMADLSKNEQKSRYEIALGGQTVGFADYQERGKSVVLPHTEIQPQHEGQGLGSQLARFALDDIRARGKKVVPACPFIRVYIERHPEYADLLEQ